MDSQERQTEPELNEGYAISFSPMRWKPYSPKSEQFRKGRKGRWQMMNFFGGWDNCEAPDILLPYDKIDQIKARFEALR